VMGADLSAVQPTPQLVVNIDTRHKGRSCRGQRKLHGTGTWFSGGRFDWSGAVLGGCRGASVHAGAHSDDYEQ